MLIEDRLKVLFRDVLYSKYQRFFPPFGLRILKRNFPNTGMKQIAVLDIGCGNHAPTRLRNVFPGAKYFGVDRASYNLTEEDLRSMDVFIILDLETNRISRYLEEGKFELINFSHVIEHLDNGEEVLRQLRRLQPPKSLLYIETPSEESLHFVSRPGTLNFFDDPTHKRVYSLEEITNILRSENYLILKSGKRRDYRRILLFPLLACIFVILGKRIPGPVVWDIIGFANYLLCLSV